MSTFDCDLFVIGGARLASGVRGTCVRLAGEDRHGRTCVVRGCVPKTLMVFASEFP